MDDIVECKHPGCERPKWRALGYCSVHYQRFSSGRDMDAPIRNVHATDQERFWEKVKKTDSCWIWTGATQKGYGVFRIDGAARLAHRVAYRWVNGDVPDDVHLDHMCHTKSCVRPDHVRFANSALNGQNRATANSNSKSGVRGVYWCNTYGHWVAKAMLNRKPHHIGIFDNINDAAEAVTAWRREHMPYSLMDKERKAS